MNVRNKKALTCMCILLATMAFLSISMLLCGTGRYKDQSLTRVIYVVSDMPTTIPHVPNMRASRSRAISVRMAPPHDLPHAVRVRPAPRPKATVTGHFAFSAQELRIRSCESGNGHGSYDYRAHNPTSTASGAWQVLDSTWGGFMGYARAAEAPEQIQDRFAKNLFDAQGTSPWLASNGCWR